ncbi:TIGR03557 family F420-dependent LLM class oxidoreductase [Catellatospora sp. KI3]|uniref:TIGR03557 family F420-dependent LLM class oxidoreductase n=1 Tax=Catellatospora sp. KI3 TaxID=3041620 RepID=UPI00248301EF|nr:TIGR03557 family F420-dependent LLM class oxidoreductase [Catellatospora sp. KI3]MDI1466095.1 TIGR03557 family F420-dependent LLM class oxidoreductase [Catellatospora sp. KI3]
MKIGFFLSSEEYSPPELLDQARRAEDAGFHALWISDHFHPWVDAQGHSPFVWSMIGALSQVTRLPITTAVTCPTVRTHPAIIAQAAATSAVLTEGRFILGVGSGEALNEHITGDHWPPAKARLDMLEEAVGVIRELWTGADVEHDGEYYTVENARIYTMPEVPPEIYVSGLAPNSTKLAGRIGDGYISTQPDAQLLQLFRDSGGAGKPTAAGAKACFAADRDEAVRLAHRLWPTSGLSGELSQVLPTPAHFQQASEPVTPESVGEKIACGPDPQVHRDMIARYRDAGFDELYVASVGPHYADMIDMYAKEILPQS